MDQIRHNLGWIEVTIAVVISATAVLLLWFGDLSLTLASSDNDWIAHAKRTVRNVAEFNKAAFYVGFALLLLYGYWRQLQHPILLVYAYLIAQGIGSIACVRILKTLTGHARPHTALLQDKVHIWIGPTWDDAYHSFPSGHTSDLFTGAIFASLLVRHVGLRLFFIGIAVYVGWERVALQKHFTSDVLFGALIGSAASFAVVHFWLLPRLQRVIVTPTQKLDGLGR